MAAHVSTMDTDDPPESVASSAASPWAAATALQAAYPDEDLSEFMVGPVREDVAGGGDSDSEDADAPSDEECAVIVLDPEEVDRRRKLRRIARSTEAWACSPGAAAWRARETERGLPPSSNREQRPHKEA